ncbi:MAG: hypothetical protein ACERKZ_06600 [Lachnotalea sp.]
MRFFNNRTVGFRIGLIASCLMLIGDILFIITDHADRTFSMVTFILILIGVVGEGLVILKNYKFTPLLPSICFGVAMSWHFYLGLPTLSDIMNGVNFIGGNPNAVIVFGVIFLIGTLAAIVSCFMEQSKLIK